MSEDRLETAIHKGARAEALLDSDVFNEAVAGLQAQLMERWKIATDAAERERIWHCVNLTEQLRHAIVTIANNGKLARRELAALTTGKAKRFGIV
jgi:hypothetical protein